MTMAAAQQRLDNDVVGGDVDDCFGHDNVVVDDDDYDDYDYDDCDDDVDDDDDGDSDDDEGQSLNHDCRPRSGKQGCYQEYCSWTNPLAFLHIA